MEHVDVMDLLWWMKMSSLLCYHHKLEKIVRRFQHHQNMHTLAKDFVRTTQGTVDPVQLVTSFRDFVREQNEVSGERLSLP